MMTREENELLTQVGPGSPAGELLRRYWQPVALSEEVPLDGAVLPVKLLGEDLVLFRNDDGRPGLLGIHCSHRGADLSYGRSENGGLRCIYHGWLYDIHGRCLDQPGEPGGGKNRDSIRQLAYPCKEIGGIILAYMGPGDSPLLPVYEVFTAAEQYRYLPTKSFHECNYLQGNEGNLDPVHLSFLHRLKAAPDARPNSSGGTGLPKSTPQELNTFDVAPTIDVELTDYGLRIYCVRNAPPDKNYVRVTNFIMPNLCAIGGGIVGDGYQIDWIVPTDDTHHWKYTLAFSRSRPLADRELKDRRASIGEGYLRKGNSANRYLQNREDMKTRSFSGLGTNFLDHDAWAVESQGPIQDRTQEQLGSTDKAIVAQRKLLRQAIRDVQEGRDPLHVIRDSNTNRFPDLFVRHEILSNSVDWKNYWKKSITVKEPDSRGVSP